MDLLCLSFLVSFIFLASKPICMQLNTRYPSEQNCHSNGWASMHSNKLWTFNRWHAIMRHRVVSRRSFLYMNNIMISLHMQSSQSNFIMYRFIKGPIKNCKTVWMLRYLIIHDTWYRWCELKFYINVAFKYSVTI